jgi:hypothetical protein
MKRLKNNLDWLKIYKILHSIGSEYNPDIEHMYNHKNKTRELIIRLFNFGIQNPMKEEKEMTYTKISSIVYSNKLNKIEEDIMIAKSDKNSIHVVNNNLFGGFSSFIPACEEVVSMIQ